MRRLVVNEFLSLDGVAQAPGGADEDRDGGFAHGGWAWPHMREEDEAMGGVFSRPFALLLGRRTYDIFAGYWPRVPSDAPHGGIADAFNAATKHVATHHPDTLAWPHSQALGDGWQWSAQLGRQYLKTDDRLAYAFGCSAEGNYDRYMSMQRL